MQPEEANFSTVAYFFLVLKSAAAANLLLEPAQLDFEHDQLQEGLSTEAPEEATGQTGSPASHNRSQEVCPRQPAGSVRTKLKPTE